MHHLTTSTGWAITAPNCGCSASVTSCRFPIADQMLQKFGDDFSRNFGQVLTYILRSLILVLVAIIILLVPLTSDARS